MKKKNPKNNGKLVVVAIILNKKKGLDIDRINAHHIDIFHISHFYAI